MAFDPTWLFKVMYSDLTPEDFLEAGLRPNPTFIFDNAKQASECFFMALEDRGYDNSHCAFEGGDEDPWSLTCTFNQFKLDGKVFDVQYYDEDCEDHIHTKKMMKINYTPVYDSDDHTKYISWMMNNYKRCKELVVDLSQSGWKTKKQIYEWLTNETFD